MADLFDDEDIPAAPEADGPMTEEEIGAMLKQEIEAAAGYYEEFLAPARAEATKRYKGEPYGDEEEGRSTIVARTTRDTVMQIMPSLLRIFTGPRRVVEFEPERPDAEDAARQRTDYVNMVFMKDNNGFKNLHTAFKDALVRKYAVWKWWWEDSTTVEQATYEGLTEEQVAELANDETIEDFAFEEDGEVEVPPDPDELTPDPMLGEGAPAPGPRTVKTYTARFRRQFPKERVRIAILPGEEFIINRGATCIEDAKLVAHRRLVTRSELVAMGYTPEFIEEHEGSESFRFLYGEEALARRPDQTYGDTDYDTDDVLASVEYTEAYRALDRDEDGIAELYKICMIGTDGFIARMEPATEIPFEIMCPDPEPHELVGQGYHDILADLERINTVIMRLTLDSFALTVTPRTIVDEKRVNMMDVLNTEIGGVVRAQGIDAMQNLETPFQGTAGLQMLEYFRTMTEERGGVNRASQGLDADSLQSTTKAAVAAQVTAAQQRIELLARIFAESIARVCAGVQRLCMQHQSVARTVRLRGEWVAVDPRTWNAPLDVRVNVGLGAGPPEDRVQRLFGIADKQELILQTLGPSPLVTFDRYRNTLARIAEAGGDDADSFFGDVPPGWSPPPPPTPSDPAMLLAEAQAKEIEAKLAIEHAKLEMQREKMLMDAEIAREKMAQEQVLKVKELELKHLVDLKEAEIKREIAQAKVDAAPAGGAR